ncbi:MAG: hypothetical protein GX811_05570 [Lentisphaerae bacterium]|nr:hypothetical protein [Lentisphaerota bacterium]
MKKQHKISRLSFLYSLLLLFLCTTPTLLLSSVVPPKNDLIAFPEYPDKQFHSQIYEVTVEQVASSQLASMQNVRSAREKMLGLQSELKPTVYTDAVYADKMSGGQQNHWASFVSTGKVTVRVKLKTGQISRAAVFPLTARIPCKIERGVAVFELDGPNKVQVAVMGFEKNPLFLFVENKDLMMPERKQYNTLYFEPGFHNVGELMVKDPVVHIAEGAFVQGSLVLDHSRNSLVIKGLGVLLPPVHGDKNAKSQPLVSLHERAHNIDIQGITLVGAQSDAIRSNSQNLFLENVKIISSAPSAQGVAGMSRKTITECFIKTPGTAIYTGQSRSRIINNTIYTENTGPVLHFGRRIVQNIEFTYVDQLRIIGTDASANPAAKSPLFIFEGFQSRSDVSARHSYLYLQNITTENENYQIFSFKDATLPTDLRQRAGVFNNSTFKNCHFRKMPLTKSVFDAGTANGKNYNDFTFDNFRVAGTPVAESNFATYLTQEGNVGDFKFTVPTPPLVKITPIPVKPMKTGSLVIDPPLPDNRYRSDLYEVLVSQDGVGGGSVYVYKSENDRQCHPVLKGNMCLANHWASFGFSGRIRVKVRLLEGTPTMAEVRPLSKKIVSKLTEDRGIEFTITEPGQYYVFLEGFERQPVFLFADPVEKNAPNPLDRNVLYFGPGIHDVGKVELTDNRDIYIAGGAYVRGLFVVNSPKNDFQIFGRGIISGDAISHVRSSWGPDHLLTATAKSIKIEGVTFTDSPACSIVLNGLSTANNIKVMSWESQTDGLTARTDGSVVANSFFKTMDDTLHATGNNKKFENLVLFHEEHGSLFQLGWGVRNDAGNFLIDGIDLVGNYSAYNRSDAASGRGAAFIACANITGREDQGATVRKVIVRNVRVDTRISQFVSLEVCGPGSFARFVTGDGSIVNYSQGRGAIQDVLFENIILHKPPAKPMWFNGNGVMDGYVRDISFKNDVIDGIQLTDETANSLVSRTGKTENFQYLQE